MAKYGQVPDATRSWAGLNAVPADVLIVLTEHDKTGALLSQYMVGTDAPEGLATAGPSLHP